MGKTKHHKGADLCIESLFRDMGEVVYHLDIERGKDGSMVSVKTSVFMMILSIPQVFKNTLTLKFLSVKQL